MGNTLDIGLFVHKSNCGGEIKLSGDVDELVVVVEGDEDAVGAMDAADDEDAEDDDELAVVVEADVGGVELEPFWSLK